MIPPFLIRLSPANSRRDWGLGLEYGFVDRHLDNSVHRTLAYSKSSSCSAHDDVLASEPRSSSDPSLFVADPSFHQVVCGLVRSRDTALETSLCLRLSILSLVPRGHMLAVHATCARFARRDASCQTWKCPRHPTLYQPTSLVIDVGCSLCHVWSTTALERAASDNETRGQLCRTAIRSQPPSLRPAARQHPSVAPRRDALRPDAPDHLRLVLLEGPAQSIRI